MHAWAEAKASYLEMEEQEAKGLAGTCLAVALQTAADGTLSAWAERRRAEPWGTETMAPTGKEDAEGTALDVAARSCPGLPRPKLRQQCRRRPSAPECIAASGKR